MDKDITLQQLTSLYHENLAGRILTYEVKHKETPFLIKFDEGHLAHLLGLHYFGYKKGEKIYSELLRGTITFKTLEERNEGAFKENHFRMLYFNYIMDVLKQPRIIVYNSQKSRIKADFMFYSEEQKRFLSLGIRKEDGSSKYHIPVTFLESKKNKWSNNKHIPLQR